MTDCKLKGEAYQHGLDFGVEVNEQWPHNSFFHLFIFFQKFDSLLCQ